MTAQIEEEIEKNETTQVVTEQSESAQQEQSDQDKNWKAFLEKRKEEQKLFEEEREKNKRLSEDNVRRQQEVENLKEAFKALVEKKETSHYDSEDDERNKHISNEVERLFSQREKKRDEEERQRKFQKEIIDIKEQMPDLLDICNQENLAYLEYHNPEIAIPIGRMPDGFEKTKLAYQAIKKHVKMAKQERSKIEQNLSKPKSMHSTYSNESQKEESSGHLSEKKRDEVWQKMQRLISGEDED